MKTSATLIGGKAEGLQRLSAYGCRVPQFLALSAASFRPFLSADYSLRSGWIASPAFVALRELLASTSSHHFGQATKTVRRFAVRSSAIGEDGAQHAHPGMLDTLLDVGPEEVERAIQKVVKSANSERVLAYRKEKGLTERLLPAVLIQDYVAADYSGVLFSTYPVYPNELLIHTVKGSGEALVQGELQPVEVIFDKASRKCTSIEIPEEEEALPEAILQELFETASALEQAEGHPVDLEFCVADGQVYWLQMRPITTPLAEQLVLDNANIQESYCGTTSNLSFTFAERAYATVYRQTMRALGITPEVVAKHEEVVQSLLYHHQGRVYYNINNWYRGLQLLPAFRQNKADLERMMGLESPVSFVVNRQKSWWQTLRSLPRLGINLLRLLWAFRRLPTTSQTFERQVDTLVAEFYENPVDTFSSETCFAWYQRLNQELLERWEVPIINDFYVMMQNGKAHRKLQKQGIADPETWLRERLHQSEDLPSLAPMLALRQLAAQAGRSEELVALLQDDVPQLWETLSARFPSFCGQVQDFIYRYGDRVMGELKMETITMRVDPSLVLRYLRPMLSADQTATVQAATRPTSPLWLQPLKAGIFRREALRLHRTRLFGMYRSLYRRMGTLLQDAGQLDAAEDIFLYRLEELEHFWQTGDALPLSTLLERQQSATHWSDEEPPGRVYLPGRPTQRVTASPDGQHWQGQAAVAGEAEGELVCISSPEDYQPLQGKILCALRTDPGWAPLFPGCKGVIIERGSSLSHSVIVLRELGIPTLINLPGVTQALQSGQRVRLNGNTGQLSCL